MNLIIDANIFISSLIKQGKTTELLLDLSFELSSPEFVLEEIQNHQIEILEKTKRTEEEFRTILDLFKEIVTFFPQEDFKTYLPLAQKISPDPDDAMYFALALKLQCPLWSNDKQLKNQNVVKVYSTEDLAKLF